jgi:stalled ribosome rescue protein Dom34
MTLPNAVVNVDHHRAEVLRFDAVHAQGQRIRAHDHYTRQHGSAVRTEHEFFGEICDALSGVTHILVVGSHTAQADFRHYVEKHRSTLVAQIVGWKTVDHPNEGQLLALAREYFIEHESMARTQPRMP